MYLADRRLLKSRLKKLTEGPAATLSKREVALMCGWRSHSLLFRVLNGEVNTVEDTKAIRLAHILGVGVDDLFETRTSTAPQQVVAKKAATRPVRVRAAA